MKRTIDVNIGGLIFHIDDDAYEDLNNYLKSLKNHYGDSDEGKEIINDIESRVAELLNERKSGSQEVISQNDIRQIITILGNPEEIFDEEKPKATYKVAKKLYRDADNRIFGGVAAGLAAYFGIPIALVRILYIILAFASLGIAILIYLLLWIVTPKAITAKQKLEMKGKPINVSNIEESIKQEYTEVKENLRTKSPKLKRGINNFWAKLSSFFLAISKIILVLIGSILIFIGVIALLSIIASLFLSSWIIIPFNELSIYNIIPEIFFNSTNSVLFFICIFLVSGIPFIMLIFGGLKLIFKLKTNTPIIIISLICLWFFGIINIALLSTNQIKQYSFRSTDNSKPTAIESTLNNKLHIKTKTNLTHKEISTINFDNIRFTKLNGETILLGKPILNFEKSESGKFEILLKRESRGKDLISANENLRNITYKWSLNDSILYLDKYFEIKGKQHWKNQKLYIIINVPENNNIVLEKNISQRFNFNSNDFYDFYLNNNENKEWIMKENGRLQISE